MSGFFSDCCVSSFVSRLAQVVSVETGQADCPVVAESTGPPDRMLVRLFVYLFSNKCRIANIFQSDIAIIQLATCNTATIKLFAVKLRACQSCVYANSFSSLLDVFIVRIGINSGCTPHSTRITTIFCIMFTT